MKRIIALLRWINVLIILATFIAYLAPYISPIVFWPVSVFGLAFPVLLILNICCIIGWVFLRKKYFLFSLGCILMGWSHTSGLFGWHTASADLVGEEVTILTYNLSQLSNVFHPHKSSTEKKERQKFENWINRNGKADVYLFQEISVPLKNRIKEILGMPHIYKPETKSQALFSKYPILQEGIVELGTSYHSAIWVDLKINKSEIIRVYSVHLKSSNLDRKAIDKVTTGQVPKKETWTAAKTLIGRYRERAKERVEQSEKLLAHLKTSPYPVVIGGDFNETPSSYVYHQFYKILHDTFQEKGSGLATTYGGKLPLLKIDYIFTDPRIKTLKVDIDRVPFSDHYPLKARLLLP